MALSMENVLLQQQVSTNLRVLVIDHDINLLSAIEKICSQFNYSVKTCSKVSEALYLLMEKENCFDMVLIEAQMPDMDSYDFLQHVTQKIKIPVIMMSVDDTVSVTMKAIEYGACDYWIKPLREKQVKIMWQHVARKIWNENKNKKVSEKLEVEAAGMKNRVKDESKLPLIDATLMINNNVIKESAEKNKDKHVSQMKKNGRVAWSPELHQKFVGIVTELNVDKAVPKKILEKMNVTGLTREHVASHLQKYRLYLKRGETKKKQKKQNETAEITESNNSNDESSEFDFNAYETHAAALHNTKLQQKQNQNQTSSSMSYGCGSSQQIPNNLIWKQIPHHETNNNNNNIIVVNAVPVNIYQATNNMVSLGTNPEEQSSPVSINQQSYCSDQFGTNAAAATHHVQNTGSNFLAYRSPSPSSSSSNDSTSSNIIIHH